MKKKQLLKFPVSTGAYQEFVQHIIHEASAKQSNYTCVANVHMLIEAHKDPAFAAVVNNAATVTPDGKPLVWGLRLLYGIKQDRVAGMDLLPDLLQELMINNLSVYFYGGTQTILDKTESYLNSHYPNLQVAGMYSPPFRKLTQEEEEAMIMKINASGASVVFVVLGCPKQEKWMASMKGKIQAVMIGIGGALPVMVGEQKRAPKWMQHGGLEWLYRLAQEPRRLFKRYAVTNSWFIYLIMKEYVRLKLLGRTH